MALTVALRRHLLTLTKQPDVVIHDLTSRGPEPWVRFSPFFPHGGIPVPFTPGRNAMSVEGIWQGLKVFASADVDESKLDVTGMRGLKRSERRFGRVLGHRRGLHGQQLLDYLDARMQIYLPSYRWVLDNYVTDLVDILRAEAEHGNVVLLDYSTNGEVGDVRRPLSHAHLVARYVAGHWPTSN